MKSEKKGGDRKKDSNEVKMNYTFGRFDDVQDMNK